MTISINAPIPADGQADGHSDHRLPQPFARPFALSFTGGKDCTLALHLLTDSRSQCVRLVTFGPKHKPFRSHPKAFIKAQAECLGLPHEFCYIEKEPYIDAYRSHFWNLAGTPQDGACQDGGDGEPNGIRLLATGDILPIAGQFMDRAVEGTPVSLLRPLWKRDRDELMDCIYKTGITFIISCCNLTKIPEDAAKRLVGRVITRDLHQEVIREGLPEVDGCGEYGEFHTMVVDAPMFRKRIVIEEGRQVITEDGVYMYFDIEKFRVVDK
ncbi:hypothetical protein HK102_003770 [Quaeritorhiza haematococci]|nr:hypothetical protein HK102_003770 [Quaeritorhiza haematococci]